MSEKRFIWKCDDENCQIYDTKKKKAYFNVEVVELLNEQQSTIQSLQREIEELGISINLFEEDIATKDKKIDDQQSIINHCKRKTWSGKKMNEEKSEELFYYNANGLSPNQAFEQGLISNEEFVGFIKGNVIKYVVRCDKKGNPIDDINKAISYLQLLKKIMRFDE